MGSQQHQQQPPVHICGQTLDDPELRAALQAFCHILSTCMGPHGCIKTIQNSVGGPSTLTSCSSRLLNVLSFSKPCIRVIVATIMCHLRGHRDGGLLAGSLCLHLINNALNVEGITRKSVRDLYGALQGRVEAYLKSEVCSVCVNIDTSNVRVMLSYVRSLIVKPVCGLRSSSLEHLSQLILRAFLNSVPDTPQYFMSDRLFVLQLPNTDIMLSEVRHGLLIQCPEISALKGEQDLQVITSKGGDIQPHVRVLLVNSSMSGDIEEMAEDPVEARPEVIGAAAESIIAKMIVVCDWMVKMMVGLLLCQKVIHPRVKAYLRSKGILFADRLGIKPVAYIQDLTGATPISSIMITPSASDLGQLTSVQHRLIQGRSYLHLEREGSSVNTLLLCAGMEEQLAELNAVVQSAITGLYSVLQRPQVLCGGGCLQVHLAMFARRLVQEEASQLAAQLYTTRASLLSAVTPFAESLEAVARSLLPETSAAWVDPEHCHLWAFPEGVDPTQESGSFTCGCGLLTAVDIDKNKLEQLSGLAKSSSLSAFYRNYRQKRGPLDVENPAVTRRLVLDTKDCVVSAVRTAVNTAHTVLSVSQFIFNGNERTG